MSGEVLLRLFIPGRARTKGHMTPGHIRGSSGRPCKVWLKDRDETKAWMKVLIYDIRLAHRRSNVENWEPHTGPVELHTFFRFERTIGVAGEAWPSHDTEWPMADDIGDEDTLRRAIGDALTQARVIEDDKLVIGGYNRKRWCRPGEAPGVAIAVCVARDPDEAEIVLEETLLGGAL